jgi:hypothetical protein
MAESAMRQRHAAALRKGHDGTGYVAEADDALYIVECAQPSDPHRYTIKVHRTKKTKVPPILWTEALTNPRRQLIDRLIAQGHYISYRTIMDTIREGIIFAERDYKRRKEGEQWRKEWR